jgi:site-specific DNA-methyltransferase (adenine-specific)/modification methylase
MSSSHGTRPIVKWKGIACDKVGESNGARQHPTQKPIALMSWCIKEAKLAAGQIVIDPYMGTGTTGVAATRAGHPFIGVEVDPTYFAIACSRIDVEQRQERMFA